MFPREHGQHHEQSAVKLLDQPVASRMIWSRPGLVLPQHETQLLHEVILKLAALIQMNNRRHAKTTDDQLEKRVCDGNRR